MGVRVTSPLLRTAMRKLALLTALRVFCQTAIAAETSPLFSQDVWHGGGAVSAFAQTRDGDLWLGLASGLSRQGGIPSSIRRELARMGVSMWNVRSLVVDRDDHLWIATDGPSGTTAEKYDGNKRDSATLWLVHRSPKLKIEPLHRNDQRPVGRVSAMEADASGAVWIGTHDGLLQFSVDGKHLGTSTEESGLPSSHVSALAFEPNKRALWIGTAMGLAVKEPDRFRLVGERLNVGALVADQRGQVWVGHQSGLGVVADEKWRIVEGETREIASLEVDRNGEVWFGSSSGLFSVVETSGKLAAELSGISEWVVSLFADKEGSLWMGTRSAGTIQRRPTIVANIGTHEAWADDIVFAVLEAANGDIWMTGTRGVTRIRQGKAERWKYGSDIPSFAVRSIAEAPDGSLFFTAEDKGLVQFNGSKWRTWKTPATLAGRMARAIAFDTSGRLWIGWSEGGISWVRVDEGESMQELRSVTNSDGLCPAGVSGFAPRRNGGFWVLGKGGVGRLALDTLEVSCVALLPATQLSGVLSVLEDDVADAPLVSIDGGGLHRLTDGRLIPVKTTIGVGADVFGIANGDAQHLWMTSTEGVHWLDRRELTLGDAPATPLSSVHFSSSNGMRAQECVGRFNPALAVDGNARLWAPTLRGASVIKQPKEFPASFGPPRIERVIVNGADYGDTIPPELPRGPVDLELELFIPSYLLPSGTTLSYELAPRRPYRGLAQEARAVRFDELAPGSYSFSLSAHDFLERPLGAVTPIKFSVPPQIHRTWWFVTLLVLGLAVTLWVAHRMRMRVQRAHFEELQADRARIARELHDTLAQGLSAAGLEIDRVHMALPSEDHPAAKSAERARATIDACQLDVRRSIWDIRRTSTQAPSLRKTIDDVIFKCGPAIGFKVKVSNDGTDPGFTSEVAHEVSRIVSEALRNTQEHSSASEVRIDWISDPEGVIITVADNGKGFTSVSGPDQGQRLGLLGITERAKRIGARVTIDGHRRGGGTRIEMFVPNTHALASQKREKT